MKQTVIKHEFVEYIPSDLNEGVLYISIPYATAAHKCCCGCGNQVVTPLTPTDWELTYNGDTVSLDPSIGNWNFPCQSHYWIIRDKVQWARPWSKKEIQRGREADKHAKAVYFPTSNAQSHSEDKGKNLWKRLGGKLFG